jgi:hypothetical protein
MEGTEPWGTQVRTALDGLRARLETQELPRLQQNVGIFSSTYLNLYQLLLRKSLIQEDRYAYDGAPKKLGAPSDDAIPESQARDQVGTRLAALRAQLELLVSSLQPSLDWLTLPVIRSIGDVVQYVRWTRLTETSESPTTRAVAGSVGRIRGGTDSVSTQLASTTLGQLDRVSREIVGVLERATAWHKEAYKAWLRDEVLPAAGAGASDAETTDNVRRHLGAAHKGRPFYPELLAEVLAEDAPGGEDARARALARLAGPAAQPRTARASIDQRDALMQAVRQLAAAGAPLADCAVKVAANDHVLRTGAEPRGLQALLKRFARKHAEAVTYKIEFLDGAVMRSETIEIAPFLDDLRKTARLLAALVRPDGPAAAKLAAAAEASVLAFVDRQLQALQAAHRRLSGLSEAFRKAAPADAAGVIKGIKLELTSLKNFMVRANQLRHEYTGAREREAQEKRLKVKD